jgi:integrase
LLLQLQREACAADPYVRDLFTALIETGCRPGELHTLQWADVHRDHFVIVASKAKVRASTTMTSHLPAHAHEQPHEGV